MVVGLDLRARLDWFSATLFEDFDLKGGSRGSLTSSILGCLFLSFGLSLRNDVYDFDIEEKRRVGWNRTDCLWSVCESCWANKLGLGALSKVQESFIPTLDDSAVTNDKLKRLSTVIARVEDSTIDELALVVSKHFISFLQLVSVFLALFCDDDFELGKVNFIFLFWLCKLKLFLCLDSLDLKLEDECFTWLNLPVSFVAISILSWTD